MDKIKEIENRLGLKLPLDYKLFLTNVDKLIIQDSVTFCRILQDNYRTDGLIYEFLNDSNFLERNVSRQYLIEHQKHFKNPKEYVEAEYLYYVATGTGAICIALGGLHYGKIFSVDNGDFGIIYQAENIDLFINSLYKPSQYRCTHEDLINSVKANDLELLIKLIETKDGDKHIQHSSWLDIELFEIAHRDKFDIILRYLISKGFRGHNRAELHKINY